MQARRDAGEPDRRECCMLAVRHHDRASLLLCWLACKYETLTSGRSLCGLKDIKIVFLLANTIYSFVSGMFKVLQTSRSNVLPALQQACYPQ
jgi:hypothetical protein